LRPVLAGADHYVACHFPLIEAAEVPVATPDATDVSINGH
jgi:hypothetical protein